MRLSKWLYGSDFSPMWKGLVTLSALILIFPRVCHQAFFETEVFSESLLIFNTLKWFLCIESSEMIYKTIAFIIWFLIATILLWFPNTSSHICIKFTSCKRHMSIAILTWLISSVTSLIHNKYISLL